jgi:3-hydroxymyristoyl/3-hydroxydecanoyl-(acyl carrier protein) dehydratase
MFAGHFPQQPIVPGALLLDAALAAILPQLAATVRIASLKFFRPARPGEVLSLSWTHRPQGSVDFEWRSGTERIASGTVSRPP